MNRDDYRTHDPDIRAALRLERQGAAYFDRVLAALPDAQFTGASLLPGWSRHHVVAHVAYNAQALARLVEWAATGVESPMYESSDARHAQIEQGAKLSAGRLRALHRDSSDAMDAAWRELSDDAWRAHVSMQTGPSFAATVTIWLRTREVWMHAVDLDSGASIDDFPPELVDHLLANVLSSWRGRQAADGIPNFVLVPTNQGATRGVGALDDPNAIVLRGTAVDLTRWATGRGFLGITVESGGPVPTAPAWI